MPLQSSGQISINNIFTEMVNGGVYGAGSSKSLGSLSTAAGKSAPHAVSEFYGYTASGGGGATYTASWTTGNVYGTAAYNDINMRIIKNGATVVSQSGSASGSFTFTTSDSIELFSVASREGYDVRISHFVPSSGLFPILDVSSTKPDYAELSNVIDPIPSNNIEIHLHIT